MPSLIVVLLALPLAAIALLVIVRRYALGPGVALALISSGITGATLSAFFAFSSSSVPIPPFETAEDAWLPILGGVLMALYVGFGLGTGIGALVALPYILIARPRAQISPSRESTNQAENSKRA